MPFDKQAVLKEIDSVLAHFADIARKRTVHRHDDFEGSWDTFDLSVEEAAELITLLSAIVKRLAPVASYADEVLKGIADASDNQKIRTFVGVLRALRGDYEAGRLQTFWERAHSDTFSDFLEMSEYLLEDEGLKDPAAVLAGGALEEHLRKLCDKQGATVPKHPGIAKMNDALAAKGVYGKNQQREVAFWAGIRNSAAHAKPDEFDAAKAKRMVEGIRHFITSFPA